MTAGTAFSFTVTTTGYPVATLATLGFLPAGVNIVNNGNGTATISGTPTGTTAQTSTLLIIAISPTGLVAQIFTLTVSPPLAITSAATDTATVGKAFTFSVKTTGSPAPTLSESGALPAGVTFTPGANGTATLAGTPTATGALPTHYLRQPARRARSPRPSR